MKTASLAIAVLCLTGTAIPALAEYPERPITFVISSAPGASTDTGIRTWIPHMEKCLGGATIVPINMDRADGQVAWGYLAEQAKDGYTIGMVLLPNFAIALATRSDLHVTPDSFDYLSNFYTNSPTISTRNDSGIMSLEQYLDLARKEKVNIGVTGLESDDVFIIRDIEKTDPNLKFELIPMGGGAQLIQALLGGTVDVAVISISNSAPVRDQLRTLAVASGERIERQLPGVPTFKELGFNIVQRSAHVVSAPKGIPADVHEKLTTCFTEVSQNPEFIAEATKRGFMVAPMSDEEATAEVKRVTESVNARWKAEPWIKQ